MAAACTSWGVHASNTKTCVASKPAACCPPNDDGGVIPLPTDRHNNRHDRPTNQPTNLVGQVVLGKVVEGELLGAPVARAARLVRQGCDEGQSGRRGESGRGGWGERGKGHGNRQAGQGCAARCCALQPGTVPTFPCTLHSRSCLIPALHPKPGGSGGPFKSFPHLPPVPPLRNIRPSAHTSQTIGLLYEQTVLASRGSGG